MNRIRYDCHTHSDFSGDSETPAVQMAERALALGLSGLIFTEHHDPDHPDYGIDFTLDFDAYARNIQSLREAYSGRLSVGFGVEFGLMKHLPPTLDRLLCEYPLDFVIGSLHFVDGKDPYYADYFEGRSERDCYEEFFRTEYETLTCFAPESFDTLGHMDYVVRYGPNRSRFYSFEAYSDFIDPILKYLIENGKCLEVNTAGFKYGLGEPNPCASVLRRYRELGGELLTIGSDAHEPAHLAYAFDRTAALLCELGFRYYAVFEQRRAKMLPLA